MPSKRPCNGSSQGAITDEGFPAAFFHLVEQPDVRNPIMDEALRRVRRRGRIRQPLLPDEGRQNRSDARRRATLGDLQRGRGGFRRAAELAWLAASRSRRAADAGQDKAALLGEAAPA